MYIEIQECYFVLICWDRTLSFVGATWKYPSSVQTWNHHNRYALSAVTTVFLRCFRLYVLTRRPQILMQYSLTYLEYVSYASQIKYKVQYAILKFPMWFAAWRSRGRKVQCELTTKSLPFFFASTRGTHNSFGFPYWNYKILNSKYYWSCKNRINMELKRKL